MLKIKVGYRFLQYYFLFGLLVIVAFGIFYTRNLLRQLEKETEVRTRIYAQYMRRATEPTEESSAELDIIFEEVIQKIDFPVIITDPNGEVITYTNINEKNLTPARLQNAIRQLDSEHEPIPLTITEHDTSRVLGQIHYGMSKSAKTLRSYPYFQLGFLVVFILLGVWGIIMYHKREHELIWTTLAKETAHQLATPLSSFAGWLETIKSYLTANGCDPQNRDAPVSSVVTEYFYEMERDLERMKEVLERFSRIGLPPELKSHSINAIIKKTVAFVDRRSSERIKFSTEINFDPVVRVDDVLFSWTMENLLKNSVDAIGVNPGQIEVITNQTNDSSYLEIDIIDSGEGIKPNQVKKIFKTGESSKKYGWGVGLTLAKRIIEEYHNGKLYLKESQPGKTVFTILLPLSKKYEKK